MTRCLPAFRPLIACALVATCLVPVGGASAAPQHVYQRDAMDFLKRYHAIPLRRPGNNVPRKFADMADDAIGFFRGGAPLFYRDLTEHPALKSPVTIMLMGDLHLENLGAQRLANGRVTFDLNDMDEAFRGPYTWELARAVVSVRLHAQAAGHGPKAIDRLVRRFLAGYLGKLAQATKGLARPLTAADVPGPAAKAIAEAAEADEGELLEEYARDGRLRPSSWVVPLAPATARGLAIALESYAAGRKEKPGFFKVKDAAKRVAGLASLARMRYLLLVEGPSPASRDDILLDLKEEAAPAAVPWVPLPAGSQAERARKAWAYFVPGGDPYLGVVPGGGADFLVRRLVAARADVAVSELKSEQAFGRYLDAVALVAARAHARSGKVAAILRDAGGLEKLAARLAPFAESYAVQVEADREVLKTYVDP